MTAMAALLAVAGVQFTRPAEPVSAYNLTCCPFGRNQAPHLVAAIWPQHYFDSSAWFKNAVIDGFNAWNDAPTAVFVSLEFTQDSNAQIMYWTDTNANDGPSSGGCQSSNTNGNCLWSLSTLVEGCSSAGCSMQSGTPNYDQQSVAHEEGHDLGLNHSCVKGALMASNNDGQNLCNPYPGYSCGGSISDANCVDTPQQDDINGMVNMYGNGSSSSYGGCSSTKPPLAASPSLPSPEMSFPPTLPPVPDVYYLDSVESTVGAAKSKPVGTATGVADDALAATGKVVPWSAEPHLPVLTIGGHQLDPNPQPC